MKQFNLEEYPKNPSRKVVTRDGRKVRIICTDKKMGKFPLVALVTEVCTNGEQETLATYTKDGIYYDEEENSLDLFFAPEKHEGYVNLLKDLNGYAFIGDPNIYKSKEDAERGMKDCSNYIASAKIEWEE